MMPAGQRKAPESARSAGKERRGGGGVRARRREERTAGRPDPAQHPFHHHLAGKDPSVLVRVSLGP